MILVIISVVDNSSNLSIYLYFASSRAPLYQILSLVSLYSSPIITQSILLSIINSLVTIKSASGKTSSTYLHNLIVLSLPRSSILPWHFYYIFKPFEYLFEKELIQFLPTTDLDNIESMIKNLEDEVKFIHENKFRQI